jgi:cytochrome c oxidase subunit 2
MKIATVMATLFIALSCSIAESAEAPQIVKVTAKRFEFTPHEIVLKKGVTTIIQLSTEDRSHGFNIPSMHLRADISPGKVSELRITPDKTGEYDFFCDVFCGSGHEGMGGKIKVNE